MDGVAEGLWELADLHERSGEIGKSIKCLEAICQSTVSFLPIIEVKTRLRIATLLLKHTNNVNHAKAHLERSQLLLKAIPSCFELKCRAYSLLSQCYHLVGAVTSQKQLLNKGLELTESFGEGFSGKLWSCNFNSQLANALIIEGDYQGSVSALEHGYVSASEMYYPELQMFFATSVLHVHLMQWDDGSLVESAVTRCNDVWESVDPERRQQCLGLFFYNELLHIFYLLRICDYKNAGEHVDKLDASMKDDLQKMHHARELNKELNIVNEGLSQTDLPYKDRSTFNSRRNEIEGEISNLIGPNSFSQEVLEPAYFGNVKRELGDKLELAPTPIDGEWLPKTAVYSLVDLMVVVFNRPKGVFKECGKRIQSGLNNIKVELVKYGIFDGTTEVDLQHSAIWMAGVYLMILMQFLENKVAIELTRSEFVEAQEALLEMKDWFNRFPTILQACESIIEMLRGQYAHCVACYNEAAFHFVEAGKLTESKSAQAICHIYAAVSYICIGDPDSYAKALELAGPIYKIIDSFVGVREKTTALFAYGFLLMRQENLQDARVKLASGLQTTHMTLGNLQLVSQYLTILGHLALALHDTSQAREILRSSLTLAKKLYDIPTQIWVLSNLTTLYEQVDEKENELENREYEKKKVDELKKRLANARSSAHHLELIEKTKFQVRRLHENDIKRAIGGPSMSVDLDIPESVGLSSSAPRPSTRLMDVDLSRRGTRKR
ncbi:sister chromatid cohesion protein SCC4 [Rutidosis leptorrhynchoides]|uniref:sister chromatid cohesion protein SCC4 n=1 Tax=Rutidosis leptorrhynchoides TaxID=125765 RepID=UPI003A997C83